ncbi:MAG TPA: hypothetical protein DCG54_06020 [Anaerolineae bacterium]|nr:hypothetical protein [Anaerolineae bacterium]
MLKAGNLTLNPTGVYRLGTLLVWLGVLAWAPFIFLRLIGEKPPFWWFLPFHLLGVLGGARLRRLARLVMDSQPEKKSLYRLVGHGMIFFGVLIWVPYFYLKYVALQPVEVMNFLPFHLAGALGGLAVLGLELLVRSAQNSSHN